MIRLVQRRMSRPFDPLALYSALTDSGSRADTALFEGARGERLIIDRAAVRAECRGSQVRLQALNANGRGLLAAAARALPVPLRRATPDLIELDFPLPDSEDLEERLLAPAPLHAIRSLLRCADSVRSEPFGALAFGVVAFEHGAFGETIAPTADEDDFPDYLFWIADSLVLFETGASPQLICASFGAGAAAEANYHDAAHRIERLVARCEQTTANFFDEVVPSSTPPAHVETDFDDNQFAELVNRMKDEIAAGEIFQIVPSRTFRFPCPDPMRSFAALRRVEENSYRFFVRGADFTLIGASPETSVRLKREDGAMTVEIRPIAGTRRRGADPDEDGRLEADLRLDEKELAEHMMLVDLARNDVARVSLPGTCRVARLLTVERHARVMHLVSSVVGRLAIGLDAFDALAAGLNVGTLSGAPKIRATELLFEAEASRRGPYGGAIGWINGAGLMETAVVIRSALVRDGIASVRAGAGVVHDSIAEAEVEETRRKAEALLSVLGPEPRRAAA